MDELLKGLDISVVGPVREKAIESFLRQMTTWAIALPPVEPLVLDFGLGNFGKIGLIEYWITNESEAGYCGKYLFVFDGQTCPKHRHITKHETFFLVKGQVTMDIAEQEQTLSQGSVKPVPPGTYHSFTGLGPALLLELSMPCEISDNDFVDRRIPIGRSGS